MKRISAHGGARRRHVPIVLGAFVVILVVAGACASGTTTTPVGGASGGAAPAATQGPGQAYSERAAGGAGEDERGPYDAEPAAPREEALVVRTGSLDLEVDDLESALARARTAIVGLGGYESATQRSSGGEHQVASVTYRIPAERWDDALDSLRELASEVIGEQTEAIEVTGQVADLGARIENLESSEQALQEIMNRATRISDVLEVQAQLTQVRGEIERLSTEKAHLEEQAAYGTLAVSYRVPVVAVAEATTGWDLRAELDRAIAQLVELGQGMATIGIWLAIVVLPLVLVGGALVALVLAVARRLGVRVRGGEPAAS